MCIVDSGKYEQRMSTNPEAINKVLLRALDDPQKKDLDPDPDPNL